MKTLAACGIFVWAMGASAFAATVCGSQAHNVDQIVVDRPVTCVLSKLYEPAHFCLSGASGGDLTDQPFAVSPGQAVSFDMAIDDQADFNMEFALTCVANDGSIAKSPKVVFTVGANGPADPDISVVDLYGAQGSWTGTPQGQIFSVKF